MNAIPDASVTQDGVIYNRERPAMRDEQAIRTRMMQDIRILKLPPENTDWTELKKLGWSAGQCRAHFLHCLQLVHRDTAATIGRDVLALFAFLAFIIATCFGMGGPHGPA